MRPGATQSGAMARFLSPLRMPISPPRPAYNVAEFRDMKMQPALERALGRRGLLKA
jgi:hypothetical protein